MNELKVDKLSDIGSMGELSTGARSEAEAAQLAQGLERAGVALAKADTANLEERLADAGHSRNMRPSAFGRRGISSASTAALAALALAGASGGSHFPPVRFPKNSPRTSGNAEIDAWNERVAAEKEAKRRAKGKS